MQHMPGRRLSDSWDDLSSTKERKVAEGLIDLLVQLSRLRGPMCGSIYNDTRPMDDITLLARSRSTQYERTDSSFIRSPRWRPLSLRSLRLLQKHCCYPFGSEGFTMGPMHALPLLQYRLATPSPAQIPPVFTSHDYIKTVAWRGVPSTRSMSDKFTRDKLLDVYDAVQGLYPHSLIFGASSEPSAFRFSHGDLHDGNILIDPEAGTITGVVDWETAGFCPLWMTVGECCWFNEDNNRYQFGGQDPLLFEHDEPNDTALRNFFRTKMQQRDPDLFANFFWGTELRQVVAAAWDDPPPFGSGELFVNVFHRDGWSVARRGPLPWDAIDWQVKRWELNVSEKVSRMYKRVCAHGAYFHAVSLAPSRRAESLC